MSMQRGSLTEQVKSVDLRLALEALRDHLATELESGVACKDCGGVISSPAAPLAKQLRDTLTQLSALAPVKESVSDDLKAKRAARQAEVAERAAGGKQRRSGGNRTRS